jgi:hypothetical protein
VSASYPNQLVSYFPQILNRTWQKSIFKSLPNQLGIHLFLAKQKKLCSNSLSFNLANFSNLANLSPPRAYLRVEREHASLAHPASCAYLSGALRFLADLFLFY